MRNLPVLLGLFVLLFSCTQCDDGEPLVMEREIIGTWKLVAALADPGDGSGTFQPATGKTLNFMEGGAMTSSKSFCFGTDTPADKTGTYDTEIQQIEVESCAASYDFNNQYLEIYFFCIEGCGERYIRVE